MFSDVGMDDLIISSFSPEERNFGRDLSKPVKNRIPSAFRPSPVGTSERTVHTVLIV